MVNSKNKILISVFLFFALIYALISFVNHYLFRTYALDLGAYTNALYDYAHFKWNDSSVFKAEHENLLSDHFDLYLILLSPLSFILRNSTLLIIQWLAVLIGGLGIYTYFKERASSFKIGIWATIYFFLFFGIYSALSFDYHSNVVAAMLMPWFFVTIQRKNIIATILLFILIIISKETISIWVSAICFCLLWDYRRDKKNMILLFSFSAFAFIYFILTIKYTMPYFSNTGTYPHFYYNTFGNEPISAIKGLLSNPIKAVKLLIYDHTTNQIAPIKKEFFLFLILSGLPILYRKPQYLLMLLPLIFQKMYHSQERMWDVHAQYSIEFAPIMAIGIFESITSLKKQNIKNTLSIVTILGALITTIHLMDNTVAWSNKSQIRIYKKDHYVREYKTSEIHNLLKSIPSNAAVSSQSMFLPHLAWRDNIYQFPAIKDAEYIVFKKSENSYPISSEEFTKKTEELILSDQWEIFKNKNDFFILKRKNG